MDSIGIHISRRLDPRDGKVEVKMKETGKSLRLQPIDAREAIESRRGVLVGDPLSPVVGEIRRISPEMTEEEIVEQLERPQTVPDEKPLGHPAMRPQASRSAPPARAGTRAAQPHPLPPPGKDMGVAFHPSPPAPLPPQATPEGAGAGG